MNLSTFYKEFPNEEACVQHLIEQKWGANPVCHYCGHDSVYFRSNHNRFRCRKCKSSFSVRVGTIFQSSNLSLQTWYLLIHLLTTHKKSMSSYQVLRDLGITQKSAWFALQRLRKASETQEYKQSLKGIVEVDETLVGGKEHNKHLCKRTPGTQGRSTKKKALVIGMLERESGKVRAKVIPDGSREVLTSEVLDKVSLSASVMTDEWKGYNQVSKFYRHQKVNHSSLQFVKNEVHTNSIESFWAILKRGVFGVHHHISKKHLHRYVCEYSLRFNYRKTSTDALFGAILKGGLLSSPLPYKDLVQ